MIQNPFLPTLSNDFDKKNNLFANFYTDIDFPFIKGLNYRLNFGNNYIWSQHYFDSEFIGVSKTGRAYKNNSHKYDWTLDHILSYKKVLGESHSLDLTLLYGMRKVKYESTANNANSFTNILSGYNDIGLGGIQTISSSAWQESFLYQMARLNYGFKARYMLTATIRRDGFSGFSENEKTSLFPSMGVSWILSEEPFLDNEWIDFLKLRTSYGTNGNLTNRYSSLSTIDIYPAYVFGEGSSTNFGQEIDKLGNSNLKWEVTRGFNFGLDFSILKTRLSGSIDYYANTTSNLLFNVSIPSITGFNSIQTNVGEIQNKGIELILDYDVVANPNFNWNINFNISHNENKIISLIGLDADNDGIEDDLVGNNLFIGNSINTVYTYESEGLIQIGDEDIPKGFSVGTHRIVDQNNDGFYDPDDRVIIGRKEPAYRLGLMNAFSYKGFNFRFFINSVQGGKNGYLGSVAPPTHPPWEDYNNMMRSNFVNVDYWTPSNPNAKYSLPGVSSPIRYQYFESRSFIRIQDVILGYDINPKLIKSIGFSSAKIYLSGKNLMTITDWGGWDPETGTGLQRDARPVLKAYSIGLNFSF